MGKLPLRMSSSEIVRGSHGAGSGAVGGGLGADAVGGVRADAVGGVGADAVGGLGAAAGLPGDSGLWAHRSRLSLEVAKLLNGEIISADSVQVYRGLDIGSAKPSPDDWKEVPQHLVDILHPSEDVPKASKEIASEAYSELADLERNGRWDVAVQLVIDAGDPKAELLAANDWYRLRRRLEIIKEVKSKDLDYDFICFFLSNQRVDLYRAIDWRCEDTVSGGDGILSEARWLLDVGLLPNSNSASRAIGYRQATEYLLFCREQGGSSSPREFQKFLAQFQKASRNFAKRQLTWFRNEDIFHWLDASKPLDSVLNSICDAYHDQTGNWVVPESLKLKKDLTSRREEAELKSYRTRNRHFIKHEDCSDILDWIQRTQSIQSDTIIHT